jgi:hypothetical protein
MFVENIYPSAKREDVAVEFAWQRGQMLAFVELLRHQLPECEVIIANADSQVADLRLLGDQEISYTLELGVPRPKLSIEHFQEIEEKKRGQKRGRSLGL